MRKVMFRAVSRCKSMVETCARSTVYLLQCSECRRRETGGSWSSVIFPVTAFCRCLYHLIRPLYASLVDLIQLNKILLYNGKFHVTSQFHTWQIHARGIYEVCSSAITVSTIGTSFLLRSTALV